MLTIFGCHGCGVLGEFDSTAWNKFSSGSASSYKDDRVSCIRNAGYLNCYMTAENTDAKRKAGSVAAMQRAADALLNLIPSLHKNGIEIQLQSGGLFTPDPEQDPILKRVGYDGWVGPDTKSGVYLAVAQAGSLKNLVGDATPVFLSYGEGVIAYFSQETADYLNSVVADFPNLIARYKAQTTVSSLPPSPMLVPDVLPQVAAALKASPARKKFNTGQLILGGTVTAAALGALTAALMRKKSPGGEAPMMLPGMMGAGLRRRRHVDLGQLDEGMSTGKKVAIGAGVLALLFGGAALYAHITYGDWCCAFRQCVVAPGWRAS